MEKDRKLRIPFLDILSVRCPLDIQLTVFNRLLNTRVCAAEEKYLCFFSSSSHHVLRQRSHSYQATN